MYMLNGWWFLSSGGSYPLVFMVVDVWGIIFLIATSHEDDGG